eukprot:156536-Karenia_brevis.AAC.1
MGANAVASNKPGRCTITAIAVANGIRWDPWIIGPASTILLMVQRLADWDMAVSRQWIQSKWDLQHSPHTWARVKGPMGATQMHFMEMGWEIQFAQGEIRLMDDK